MWRVFLYLLAASLVGSRLFVRMRTEAFKRKTSPKTLLFQIHFPTLLLFHAFAMDLASEIPVRKKTSIYMYRSSSVNSATLAKTGGKTVEVCVFLFQGKGWVWAGSYPFGLVFASSILGGVTFFSLNQRWRGHQPCPWLCSRGRTQKSGAHHHYRWLEVSGLSPTNLFPARSKLCIASSNLPIANVTAGAPGCDPWPPPEEQWPIREGDPESLLLPWPGCSRSDKTTDGYQKKAYALPSTFHLGPSITPPCSLLKWHSRYPRDPSQALHHRSKRLLIFYGVNTAYWRSEELWPGLRGF